MSDIAPPSAVLGQVAKFLRVMENAGLTPELQQRVIDQPGLREQIVELIETGVVKPWEPKSHQIQRPINEERLQDLFKQVERYERRFHTIRAGHETSGRLQRIVQIVEGEATREDVVVALLNANKAAILKFAYGLTGDEPATHAQLCTYYDRSPDQILKDLESAYRWLTTQLQQLARYGEMDLSRALQFQRLGVVSQKWVDAHSQVGTVV